MAYPSGLCAVVTGSGSGLGRAFCLELARRNARLVCSDIDEAAANETAALVREMGREATVVVCDVSNSEDVSALAERSVHVLRGVDMVVNNAGVAVSGPFEAVSLEDWRWGVDINLWGVIHGCRAFAPAMKERGRGWILNVASAAGFASLPEMAPYNVSKAGVIALSETLYGELAPHGVGVTVLCPTFFSSRIAGAMRGTEQDLRQRKRLIEQAMKRAKLKAADVARVALDRAEAGELYALPMRDGRLLWRLKRAAPARFHALVAKQQKLLRRLLRLR
ncbi:MAG: SDR family NAD(P)-dependent oxidoreductase [Myxococcota bacterium]